MQRTVGPIYILVIMLVIGALTALSQTPPAPKGLDAPANEFSAARALETLRALNPDQVPHEIGSAENALVRERVIQAFAELGIEARTETETVCRSFRSWAFNCAEVTNIIAPILPAAAGGEGGKTVVLMSHYDSVGAGPGASDAMHAVSATLEVVRILRAEGALRNPVVALVTDGEERGLFGARAFFQNAEKAASVGAVINLEARGSQGQSFLFETSDDGAWLIDLFAEGAGRPVTNSLMQAAYKMMPNDTDLSETLDAGVPGVNFAYAGHVAHYHTPLDNLENLNPGSLQHQGDNLLTMVRALGAADLTAPPAGEAVYIDLFSSLVLRMPAAFALPLALLALAGVGFLGYRFQAGAPRRWGAVAAGAVFVPVLVVSVIASGFALFTLAGLLGAEALGFAHPGPMRWAFYAGAAAAFIALAASYGRWLGDKVVLVSVWGFFAVAATIAALLMPGASVLFLFPAIVAALLLVGAYVRSPSGEISDTVLLIIAVVQAALLFPLVGLFEMMFGMMGHFLITAGLALAVIAFVPILVRWASGDVKRWRAAVVPAVLALVLAVVSGLMPPYDANTPMRMNILHLTDERSEPLAEGPVWRADTWVLPDAMRAAAEFSEKPDAGLPGLLQEDYTAPAPADPRPTPGVRVTEIATTDTERRVTLAFDETEDLRALRLAIPIAAKPIGFRYANGSVAHDFGSEEPANGYHVFGCLRGACRDIIVTLAADGAGTDEAPWLLYTQSAGLPPGGEALTAARPDWVTQSQWGDATLLLRDVRF